MQHHERLAAARIEKGWTLAKLKAKSGVSCSVVSLSRKLSGQRALTDDELGKLARALGIQVKRTVVTLGAAA